ncbi:hypothetical protein AB4562_28975, partial [Vibrio sp. 10N.222.54.A1]
SVKVNEKDNGDVTISFNYSKYGLPQDIAYFRFLNVDIELVGGTPKRMVITNDKPFNLGKSKVDTYYQVIDFQTLDSGQVVIERKTINIEGTSKTKPMTMSAVTEPVAIYEDDNGVNVLHEGRLKEVSD